MNIDSKRTITLLAVGITGLLMIGGGAYAYAVYFDQGNLEAAVFNLAISQLEESIRQYHVDPTLFTEQDYDLLEQRLNTLQAYDDLSVVPEHMTNLIAEAMTILDSESLQPLWPGPAVTKSILDQLVFNYNQDPLNFPETQYDLLEVYVEHAKLFEANPFYNADLLLLREAGQAIIDGRDGDDTQNFTITNEEGEVIFEYTNGVAKVFTPGWVINMDGPYFIMDVRN